MYDLLLSEEKDIQEKIPKVDNEKKGHATARRFKEAALAAKEHKDLTSRNQVIEVSINEIKSRMSSHSAQVAVLYGKYQEMAVLVGRARLEA